MGAWPTLTASDLDLTLDTWDFQQTLSDTLGDLGTPADGFDSYLGDTFLLFDGAGDFALSLLDDLNLAAGFADSIDPASLNSDAASLPAILATGDGIVADANTLLGAVTPPPQPPAGGTGGPCGSGQSSKCGTHGDSSITLDDDTNNCDAANTLPKVSIADGPCTFCFVMDGSAFAGAGTVTATSLKKGDARLWAISSDTVTSQRTNAPASRVSLQLTPYKKGHFLARFNVALKERPGPNVWCIIVDVIP